MPNTRDNKVDTASHSDDSKDNSLKKDDETQLNKVDDCLKSTPSGSGTTKIFIYTLPPGLTVTDNSGKRTRSKSPVGVPASLICKINSQYVRFQKLEWIAKYISDKKGTV